MANNPPVDLSGDILDFRRVISWALTRKLYDLEKEIERIKLILYPEEEEISMSQPQVLSFTPDAEDYSEDQSGLKVVGHIDLTQYGPKKPKARERIGRHRLIMSGYYLSPKEEAEVFPERKALVESFLRNAAEDAGYVRDCFLLRSTLQYAVIRKEISNLNCDYYVIRQYAGELPSSNEIAAFLVDAYGGEKNLTRDLLTTLANRYSALSLLDAVCDNPFLRGRDPDFGQAKTIISDAIVGLGSGQVTFRKDMNAIMVALDNYVLQDLGIYISMAKKITRDAFSLVEFPLNEDKIEMLQFGQTAFSINLESKDEYLKALTGALHEAEEKGHISASERCAITGEAVPVAVLPNGEEPTMPKHETGVPSKEDAQADAGAPTTSSVPEEAEVLTPSLKDGAVFHGGEASSSDPSVAVEMGGDNHREQESGEDVLVGPGVKLPDTPERFLNNKAAFIKLYHSLVQDKDLLSNNDEENWCLLFKLDQPRDTPLHKMKWLSSKEALVCFVRELYQSKRIPAGINNVFYIERREVLKLSDVSFSPTRPSSMERKNGFTGKYAAFINDALKGGASNS